MTPLGPVVHVSPNGTRWVPVPPKPQVPPAAPAASDTNTSEGTITYNE
jgi:hypothetical protein